MPSRKEVQLAFGAALVFLLIAAVAAGFAISRLTQSLRWIAHAYDVQVALGDINSTMTAVGRARSGFEADASPELLEKFAGVASLVPIKLGRVKALVRDNEVQLEALDRLVQIELRRLAVQQEAVDQRMKGARDDDSQKETTRQVVALASDADSVVQEMLTNEERLLVARRSASTLLFGVVVWILIAAFLISLA